MKIAGSSRDFRYGREGGICLHLRCAQIDDWLRQAVASDSPPDWQAICQGYFSHLIEKVGEFELLPLFVFK